MTANVRVIGVRHHSPACAQLVAQTIAAFSPQAVLIEGPSDFNPRLGELLLGHTPPLAIYSYANENQQPAQSWWPLLAHSPEWVALQAGDAAGAALHFIDLPHWRYRTVPDAEHARSAPADRRTRYGEVMTQLCQRFNCDGDDTLWDHLFESATAEPIELAARLDLYFDELRGDDPGTAQDQAREAHMAAWIDWAAGRHERVLVVCGGWHKPALERVRPTRRKPPEVPQPANERAAGSYLVPYDYRQVDALGGYRAGLPSPLYYQWAWQHGLHQASERAMSTVVARLRHAQVPFSTADLVAFEQACGALARLRGHDQPLRADLLDALLCAVVKEALPTPAPWSSTGLLNAQHHPALREALLALTGDGAGALHPDTPQPPLLHDVFERMATCALTVSRTPNRLVLDRRRAADAPRAHVLWQLHCLKVSGIVLEDMRAPQAARSLSPTLNFEEHWQLRQTDRWFPDLIEASVHGATLEAAARQAVQHQAHQAGGHIDRLTQCLLQAIRAGLYDLGEPLARALAQALHQTHDHGALAQATQSLAAMVQAGFWGDDPRDLLVGTLARIAERLLCLLEARDGPGSPGQMAADVQAVQVFDTLLRLALPTLDGNVVRQTLARIARSPSKPPTLRGAALGLACQHQALHGHDDLAAHEEVLSLTRRMPARDALGPFLYGLFACARELATASDGIVQAVHHALEGMVVDDFFAALPALRAAFAWFPPRERGAVAEHVARLMGLNAAGPQHLLLGRTDALLDARELEAQALAWAQTHGLHDLWP